ncbi:MAG: hypothetical protein WC869_15810 [Phycisphaerae bacterium]|jgi:hypothetical protein
MITTLDGLVAAARTKLPFYKISSAADLANVFVSLWKIGTLPAPGVTPPAGAGEAPTSATLGAFSFTEIGAGTSIYAARALLQMATMGTLYLYDRLVHASGLNGTLLTEQVINSAALTRYTDGAGVELFLEHYTATGSTAANITVNYTNQAGVAGRISTFAFLVSPLAGLMQMVPLLDGDTGVRSVQSVTLSASTLTAGDFGITLAKRLVDISPDSTNSGKVFSPFDIGLPTILPNACLAMAVFTSTTSTGIISGSFDVLQG